jgi:hypothetical protein
MWRKPFSEGALLCGFCDDHGQVKTVGTRRAGFLPSLQHLLDEGGQADRADDAALFMPLDLANRGSIASPKSALFLPIACSNGAVQ